MQRANGGRLEPKIGLEVLSNLPNQPLERQLPDEKPSRLLVMPDLPKGHGSRAIPVPLLDAALHARA